MVSYRVRWALVRSVVSGSSGGVGVCVVVSFPSIECLGASRGVVVVVWLWWVVVWLLVWGGKLLGS